MNNTLQVKFPHELYDLFATSGSRSLRTRIETAMQNSIEELGMMVLQAWSNAARKGLTTTQMDYQKGLFADRSYTVKPRLVVVTLVGKLPNMIENGAAPWDMKMGLLKGRKYVDIPFRHGTPGEHPRMNKINQIPANYYRGIKSAVNKGKFPATMTSARMEEFNAGGKGNQMRMSFHSTTKWGRGELYYDSARVKITSQAGRFPFHLKGGGRYPNMRTPLTMRSNLAGKTVHDPLQQNPMYRMRQGAAYTHKNDVLQDMFRNTERPTGLNYGIYSTYYTIRRISAKSDPSAWIHPGFKAQYFSRTAVNHASKHIDTIVHRNFRKLGLPY